MRKSLFLFLVGVGFGLSCLASEEAPIGLYKLKDLTDRNVFFVFPPSTTYSSSGYTIEAAGFFETIMLCGLRFGDCSEAFKSELKLSFPNNSGNTMVDPYLSEVGSFILRQYKDFRPDRVVLLQDFRKKTYPGSDGGEERLQVVLLMYNETTKEFILVDKECSTIPQKDWASRLEGVNDSEEYKPGRLASLLAFLGITRNAPPKPSRYYVRADFFADSLKRLFSFDADTDADAPAPTDDQ